MLLREFAAEQEYKCAELIPIFKLYMETTISRPMTDMELYFKEEYGKPDTTIQNHFFTSIGQAFQEHAEQVINYGITRVQGAFLPEEIVRMQHDVEAWVQTKQWDKDNHIGFDGNSGERYLPKSEALSRAVSHPAIFNLVSAVMGQFPKMNFVRTVCINPIEPYERRAFQWHHDGYSEIGLRVMLLLSDVPENGQAMKYLPGTNLRDWNTASSRETRFNNEFVQSHEEYICSGKAGDIFVFTNHGVHRGQRNNTLRRDVMLINFQPGLARNYPLPGLAPALINEMSLYEKNIFGVSEDSKIGKIGDIKIANRNWRAMMAELFKEYTLPAEKLTQIFQNSTLDTRISDAGKRNFLVDPDFYPFVDFKTKDELSQIKRDIREKLEKTDNQTGKSILEDEQNLRNQIFSDMHGDLDLPIRMYHPNKDQRRDNAITQTRDGKGEIVANEIINLIVRIPDKDINRISAGKYEKLAQKILDSIIPIQRLELEESQNIKTDSFISFAEDLVDMTERAYTEEIARRNTLYTYMTSRFFAMEYGDDPRLSEGEREKLKDIAQESLITYAKFILANKM